MKAEDILLALGEIDETLPPECTQPVKKKPIPWKGIAALAACLAAVILSVSFISRVGLFGIFDTAPEDETAGSGETTARIVWSAVTEPSAEYYTEEEAQPVVEQPTRNGNYYPTTRRNTVTPATTKTTPTTSTTKAGSTCDHEWIDATCTSPRTCKKCGIIAGNPNKHSYAPATCELPEICRNCGARNGSPLGHEYGTDGYCKRCGKNAAGRTKPTATTTTTTSFATETPASTTGAYNPNPPITASTEKATTSTTRQASVDIPQTDGHPEIQYNGRLYYYADASDMQHAGAHLATLTLQSDSDTSVEVYAVSGADPKSAVLVLFSDGSCCRYEARDGNIILE